MSTTTLVAEGRTHESCPILSVLAVDRHPSPSEALAILPLSPDAPAHSFLCGPSSLSEQRLDEGGLSEVAAQPEHRRAPDRRLGNVERVQRHGRRRQKKRAQDAEMIRRGWTGGEAGVEQSGSRGQKGR